MDELLLQIESLIDPSLPWVSNLSNVASVLFHLDQVNWAGFYLVENDQLFLGPFQGEPACTKISKGKGVCGSCLAEEKTIIVEDVHQFIGHIACSPISRSEIVVPIFADKKMVALIDIDSPILNRFGKQEAVMLEKVASLLGKAYSNFQLCK